MPPGYDAYDYYFVGALIALSCAIFAAAMFIVTAKVNVVPTFYCKDLLYNKSNNIILNLTQCMYKIIITSIVYLYLAW